MSRKACDSGKLVGLGGDEPRVEPSRSRMQLSSIAAPGEMLHCGPVSVVGHIVGSKEVVVDSTDRDAHEVAQVEIIHIFCDEKCRASRASIRENLLVVALGCRESFTNNTAG